jgi:glyoxylase I family protein
MSVCSVVPPTTSRWGDSSNGSGWVQLTRDADRAGSALLNLAVDDLEGHVADISGRGLAPGAIETVSKGVQLSGILDPEGNTITFIGGFRVRY